MNNLIGSKWGQLTEDEKNELLISANAVDGATGNKMNKPGECIIDFINGLSVVGNIEITDIEDIISIDNEAVIYSSEV